MYWSFDIPVILLHKVIQVITLPGCYAFIFFFTGIERGQRRRVGSTLIDGYHFGFAMVANDFAKETSCRCCIPFCCQQKIDSLA